MRCRVAFRTFVSRMSRPASPVSPHEGEHLRVGDEYYVLASSLASRRRKHVLSHQDSFAVLDQSGDIPFALEEEMGVFFRGTRHLSQLELLARSEERRVGKECRSRWSPYH